MIDGLVNLLKIITVHTSLLFKEIEKVFDLVGWNHLGVLVMGKVIVAGVRTKPAVGTYA
jgi:hypothetical protein